MPIYEYVCRQCQRQFETIVYPSSKPSCPNCDSSDLDKQLSVFAVGNAETSGSNLPPGCGSCSSPGGPGCSLD